jgi:hypothetical protein
MKCWPIRLDFKSTKTVEFFEPFLCSPEMLPPSRSDSLFADEESLMAEVEGPAVSLPRKLKCFFSESRMQRMALRAQLLAQRNRATV